MAVHTHKQGNGLGEKNAKSWNPNSMKMHSHAGAKQSKVESEKRKGAGQK